MAETGARRAGAQKAAETAAAAQAAAEKEATMSQEQRDAEARENAAAAVEDGAGDGTNPTMNKPSAASLGFRVVEGDGNALVANTVVRHPATGEVVTLFAGDPAPDWAADAKNDDGSPLLGRHLFASEPDFGRDPSAVVPLDGSRPPGAQATRPKWAAYAAAHGVVVGGSAGIVEIRGALEAAGVPVE